MRRVLPPAAAMLLLAGASASAQEVDFYRDLYPVLKANCISCHNKTTAKGELNMESPELLRKGGESGPGVVPGKSAESLVVQAALHQDDYVMPPKNNKAGAVDLKPAEIALLKRWIDQGAKDSKQQAREVKWQPLPPGVNPIYTVALTQDGRFAACGRANQIFIYDLATRQLVTRVAAENGVAHRALVQSLAFSPDGTRLASGSFREVKIWKLERAPATAAKVNVPALAGAARDPKLPPAAAMAVSADGKRVAVVNPDGSVRVASAENGAVIAELRGDLQTSRRIAELERTHAEQQLEFTFQSREVARLEAQNKAVEELLSKAKETIVNVRKALPDKQKAAQTATEQKLASQKEAEAAAAAAEGKTDPALTKAAADAQTKLTTATMAETSAVAAARAAEHNIEDAEADVERITATKTKNAEAITAANAQIAKAMEVQTKASADIAAAKQAAAKLPPALALAFSADGQSLAALGSDGALRVWAVAPALPIEKTPGVQAATAGSVTATPDGGFTACTAEGVMLSTAPAPKWTLERVLGTGKDDALFADRVNAVRFSPDGKTLAVGGGEPSRSGDVSLWEVATGKPIANWVERHTDAVLSLDFSPDGRLLASGAADKLARVTEIATGKQTALFEGHTHHVMGVSFRSDGRVLATAGGDGVVLVWDMIMGERKKKIEGWAKEVTSIQFIGATPNIVTSAGDNRVRVVNDDGGEIRGITKLPDFMQAAASTPTGHLLIGGGEDSVLRVWDGASGKEIAAFDAR